MSTPNPAPLQNSWKSTIVYSLFRHFVVPVIISGITLAVLQNFLHRSEENVKLAITFCAGLLVPTVWRVIWTAASSFATHTFESVETDTGHQSRVYGLDHGILNLSVPPPTWWQNMGYWKDQSHPRDLPSACRALLLEVMKKAGLVDQEHGSSAHSSHYPPVHIIDVGFGCGEQTITILQSTNVVSYVGITIDRKQFQFAHQRLSSLNLLRDTTAIEGTNDPSVRIFCADAGQPSTWPEGIHRMIGATVKPRAELNKLLSPQRWLIALDTLYHFAPSREQLFQYGACTAKASIAAFDLLLEDPSFELRSPSKHASAQGMYMSSRILLRMSCLLTSTPYSNFLTPSQYRHQLVQAGYDPSSIEIIDISDHVFGPLASFLEYQDQQLKVIGKGIGVFNAAKWLFSWWARIGLVRGCIVVARCTSASCKKS